MAKTLGASLVLALVVMMIFLNGSTLAAGRGYPVNDAGGQVYQPDDCFIFVCFGQIPYEIGNCAELIHLDLSHNQLYGDVPFSLSKLKQLGNRLTGKIPEVIGLMQALAILDLSENELVGPIPPIFGNLSFTGKLYLHGNMLTGPIPPELGNMSKLSYLLIGNPLLCGDWVGSICHPYTPKTREIAVVCLTLGVLLLLVMAIVVIYRSSQSKQLMKGTGRIGQGILIICFMLLTVQSNGQFQFDYFKLALQWTTATCAVSRTPCNQTTYSQFPQAFTIHGLWPSTNSYPQPAWCNQYLIYNSSDPQFVPVKGQVSANWPDLFKPTNDIFWKHEFLKHGSCMTSNQAGYFITALNLKSRIIPDVKTAIGYAPDNLMTRNYQDIRNNLVRAYQVYPHIVCHWSRRDVLAEVRLCFDKVTWRLINCPGILQTCANDIYFKA